MIDAWRCISAAADLVSKCCCRSVLHLRRSPCAPNALGTVSKCEEMGGRDGGRAEAGGGGKESKRVKRVGTSEGG